MQGIKVNLDELWNNLISFQIFDERNRPLAWELAENIKEKWPQLRVLFYSGRDELHVKEVMLNEGLHKLQG